MGRATVEGGPATLNLGPEGQPELGTTISEAPAFTAFYDYLRARHPEHDHRYDTIWDALRPTNANTAVVLSAWSEVVDDARSLARLLEVRDGKWSVPIITSLLVSQGKLNAAYEEIASRLQSLRNKVGGATEPPPTRSWTTSHPPRASYEHNSERQRKASVSRKHATSCPRTSHLTARRVLAVNRGRVRQAAGVLTISRPSGRSW